MIAQFVGAGRRDQLKYLIGTLFSVMAIGGAALTVLALALRVPLLHLINVPPEAWDMAGDYVIICGGGLLFTVGYNAVAAILRGMGDSRHPFIFLAISSIINLILDYILTGLLGLGVAGAAFATVFSQAVSFIAAIIFLRHNEEEFHFDFRLRSFRIHKEMLGSMVKLGIPLALQMVAINISFIICNSFVNGLGVVASATFGVGMKVDDIGNKLTLGIQYAAAPMLAQNFGAGKIKRVRGVVYWTWIMAGAVYLVFTTVYLCFGRQIFALFTDDAAVIDLAPVFIRAIVWSFPGMVIMRGANSFLQGTGSARLLMAFAFIDAGARVLFSWLFGIVFNAGFPGFVLGFGIAIYGICIPGACYFLFGHWENKKSMAHKAED
jgi:putative MATE family efflux protein